MTFKLHYEECKLHYDYTSNIMMWGGFDQGRRFDQGQVNCFIICCYGNGDCD